MLRRADYIALTRFEQSNNFYSKHLLVYIYIIYLYKNNIYYISKQYNVNRYFNTVMESFYHIEFAHVIEFDKFLLYAFLYC